MPRKQRFKPSRKPKLDSQNRGATSEHQPSHVGTKHESNDARDAPHANDEISSGEPELDQRSR